MSGSSVTARRSQRPNNYTGKENISLRDIVRANRVIICLEVNMHPGTNFVPASQLK